MGCDPDGQRTPDGSELFFLSQFFIKRGGGLIINPILSPSPNCEERTMAGICVPEKCSLLPWEAAAKPLNAVAAGRHRLIVPAGV